MPELQIECVLKDSNDVITHVGIGGKVLEVSQVVQGLLNKEFTAFTNKDNQKAKVYVRDNKDGDVLFLTTNPDSTKKTWTFCQPVKKIS